MSDITFIIEQDDLVDAKTNGGKSSSRRGEYIIMAVSFIYLINLILSIFLMIFDPRVKKSIGLHVFILVENIIFTIFSIGILNKYK